MGEEFGYVPDYLRNGPIRAATSVKIPQVPGPISSTPRTSMKGGRTGFASSSTMGNPAASRLAELAASPAYAGTSAVRSVKPLPYAGPIGEIKTLEQQNALQDYLRTASPKSFVGGDSVGTVQKNVWATDIGGGKEADFNPTLEKNSKGNLAWTLDRPQGILYSPVKSGIPNTGAVTETRVDVNGNRGPTSAPLISMTAPSGKRIWLPVASAQHAETMKSYGVDVFGPEWKQFRDDMAPQTKGKQSLIEAFGGVAGLASQFKNWKASRTPVVEPEQQMTYGGGITSGGQSQPPPPVVKPEQQAAYSDINFQQRFGHLARDNSPMVERYREAYNLRNSPVFEQEMQRMQDALESGELDPQTTEGVLRRMDAFKSIKANPNATPYPKMMNEQRGREFDQGMAKAAGMSWWDKLLGRDDTARAVTTTRSLRQSAEDARAQIEAMNRGEYGATQPKYGAAAAQSERQSYPPVVEPEQQMTYGGIQSGGRRYLPEGYNPVSGYMPLPFGDSNSERRY